MKFTICTLHTLYILLTFQYLLLTGWRHQSLGCLFAHLKLFMLFMHLSVGWQVYSTDWQGSYMLALYL